MEETVILKKQVFLDLVKIKEEFDAIIETIELTRNKEFMDGYLKAKDQIRKREFEDWNAL